MLDKPSSRVGNLRLFQSNLNPSSPYDAYVTEQRLVEDLEEALRLEECFLKQKSRVNWLNSGDSNNKYFYNSCRGRWNSNKVLSLTDDTGETHTSHDAMSHVVVSYFKNILGSDGFVQSIPEDLELPSISELQASKLVEPFSEKDVLYALQHMAKNRSPGPDGFLAEFFISTWHIVGQDVTRGILHFFESFYMPRIINAAAICFVPKLDNASEMKHFRPISCCNVLYKCISKMLAGRLKSVLPSIISPYQSAFVPSRSIGDNILLAWLCVETTIYLRGTSLCY